MGYPMQAPVTDRPVSNADEAAVQLRFRDVMAQVVAPVTVITTVDGDRVHGTTVSAFMSLSMTPPMVVVSLDRKSELLSLVQRTRVFGVNVLAADQGHIALAFAKKSGDRFADLAWHIEDGLPCVDGVAAWVACDLVDGFAGGDHILLTGAVRGVRAEPLAPLSYHARTFGTHVCPG